MDIDEFRALPEAERSTYQRRYRRSGASTRMSFQDFVKLSDSLPQADALAATETAQQRAYAEHAAKEAAERAKAARMTPAEAVASGLSRDAYTSVGGDGTAWLKARNAHNARVLQEGRAESLSVKARLHADHLARQAEIGGE